MIGSRFVREILLVLSGLLIWAAHFLIVYVFNGIVCARQLADTQVFGVGIVTLAIGIITLAAIASIAAILLFERMRRSAAPPAEIRLDGFMNYLTNAVAALAVVSILLTGLPAFFLPPCG